MRPKNKLKTPYDQHQMTINNNNNRFSQLYTPPISAQPTTMQSPVGMNNNNSSPHFHFYPPAVYTMHGSNGQAYANHNNNNIQAHAPAPVYVNAPPKPRRVVQTPQQTLMVTGQYHQPLTDVQEAHQRQIQPQKFPHYNTKSLGRVSAAAMLHHGYNSGYNTLDPKRYSGSIGRQNGAMLAPRTPLMGQQIREQRRHQQMQQPQRPKSRYQLKNVYPYVGYSI